MATSTDAEGNFLYSAFLFETLVRVLLEKEQRGYDAITRFTYEL